MPAYVSHTIMARDVYNKINNKNVSLDYMLTYSLGGDLCKYAKCRRDSHRIKKDEFIYNMCDYIKDNNLINDMECMGVLYGHICHVIMDDILHSLIRKVDKSCIKNKSNHTLIEGYIDSYLVKYKYNKSIDKYDNKLLFKGKMNRKISNMIDYVYYETYNCKNVNKYYKFNIFLYKKIRYLYKIFSINMLKKISGFNKFIMNNKGIDIFNNDGKIYYKDYLGYEDNRSVIELYNECVEMAIIYIGYVNRYLGIE